MAWHTLNLGFSWCAAPLMCVGLFLGPQSHAAQIKTSLVEPYGMLVAGETNASDPRLENMRFSNRVESTQMKPGAVMPVALATRPFTEQRDIEAAAKPTKPRAPYRKILILLSASVLAGLFVLRRLQ